MLVKYKMNGLLRQSYTLREKLSAPYHTLWPASVYNKRAISSACSLSVQNYLG